jgi:hypothetical protein
VLNTGARRERAKFGDVFRCRKTAEHVNGSTWPEAYNDRTLANLDPEIVFDGLLRGPFLSDRMGATVEQAASVFLRDLY